MEKGLISVDAVNIRDYTDNKHGRVDDYTYGGGAGMLMQAQPVYDTYRAIREKTDKDPKVIYLSPRAGCLATKMRRSSRSKMSLSFCAAIMKVSTKE